MIASQASKACLAGKAQTFSLQLGELVKGIPIIFVHQVFFEAGGLREIVCMDRSRARGEPQKPIKKRARQKSNKPSHDFQSAVDYCLVQLRIQLLTLFPNKIREVSRMTRRWASDLERSRICSLYAILNRATASGTLTSNDALTLLDLVLLRVALPGFTGSEMSLKVLVCGEEIGMAAVAVACAMLIDAVGANMRLERIELEIIPLATVLFGNAIRYRQIWARLFIAIKALLRRNFALRMFKLNCPQGFIVSGLQEDLEVIAQSSSQETRMAVLMGTHERVGANSIFRGVPQEVLDIILEKCAPKVPCGVQVLNGANIESPSFYGEDLNCIMGWMQ